MSFAPDLTAADCAPILHRMLKNSIVAVMPDRRVLTHKFKKGHANDAKTFATWHRCCDSAHPGARVLNEMPFDDAVAVLTAALREPVATVH